MVALVVTLSPDGQFIDMAKRAWRQRIARADLGHWIAFYRWLATRENGRFARFYAHDLLVLESFEKDLADAD
jgi:hypothetical protein